MAHMKMIKYFSLALLLSSGLSLYGADVKKDGKDAKAAPVAPVAFDTKAFFKKTGNELINHVAPQVDPSALKGDAAEAAKAHAQAAAKAGLNVRSAVFGSMGAAATELVNRPLTPTSELEAGALVATLQNALATTDAGKAAAATAKDKEAEALQKAIDGAVNTAGVKHAEALAKATKAGQEALDKALIDVTGQSDVKKAKAAFDARAKLEQANEDLEKLLLNAQADSLNLGKEVQKHRTLALNATAKLKTAHQANRKVKAAAETPLAATPATTPLAAPSAASSSVPANPATVLTSSGGLGASTPAGFGASEVDTKTSVAAKEKADKDTAATTATAGSTSMFASFANALGFTARRKPAPAPQEASTNSSATAASAAASSTISAPAAATDPKK